MGKKQTVEALVSGGAATAGPPIGPALGPLGVNVLAVINEINELTEDFKGLKVPVKIIVDLETKDFEVEVGVPTASALILKEAGVEKGSSNPGSEFVGNISLDQLLRIARIIGQKTYVPDIKKAVLQALGTCVSMGITVEGEDPRGVTLKVRNGEYDSAIYGGGGDE